VNEENRLVSSTPPSVNWNEVIAPELKMRQIRQYEQYVALRIEVSVASGTPLTPTVAHVNEKLRKAHTNLALNGITATQEMRRLKEKSLKRSNRDEESDSDTAESLENDKITIRESITVS
jgi:hypothetical protein